MHVSRSSESYLHRSLLALSIQYGSEAMVVSAEGGARAECDRLSSRSRRHLGKAVPHIHRPQAGGLSYYWRVRSFLTSPILVVTPLWSKWSSRAIAYLREALSTSR